MSRLRPAGFANLTEAGSRLITLSGRESPLLRLPRTLALASVDFSDADVASRLPAGDAWLAKGLAEAQELQATVARFVASTEAGARGRDQRKVEEFCAALDASSGRLGEAANVLDDASARRAAAACLQNLVAAVHRGLLAELAAEAERAWSETVRKPFADACAGKFPFDPAAKIDVDVRAFSALFNPKSGALWQAIGRIEAWRKLRIQGRELFPASVEYQRAVSQAATIRSALFAGDTEEMNIPFTLTMQQREAVADEVISIGAQRFGLFERPDRRFRFEWKQSSPGGAKITITVGGDDYTRDEPAPGWGILRLMRAGVPSRRSEGGTQLTWGMISQKLGKTFFAAAVLDAPDLETLVTGDLFKTFAIPQSLIR